MIGASLKKCLAVFIFHYTTIKYLQQYSCFARLRDEPAPDEETHKNNNTDDRDLIDEHVQSHSR